MNKFTEEYVNASLNTEDLDKNLHNTEELKKDCYRRNNARNRDILTKAKASGNHISTDEMLINKKSIRVNTEENLLEQLDDDISDLKNTNGGTDDY